MSFVPDHASQDKRNVMSRLSTELTDPFGRVQEYLRISVTDRCGLGCFYCRPSGGFRCKDENEILSDHELLRLGAVFTGLGVRKVRLTGGEPLLRPGVPALVRGFKSLAGLETVGLTTNGVRLAGMVTELFAAGLDMVNVSLDSLDPERYMRITGGRSHARVLDGIFAALEAGFRSVKLNVVVVRGMNDDELEAFTALAAEHQITVRFIEYMPFSSNPWSVDRFISGAEMRESIERGFSLDPQDVGRRGQVSRDWRIVGGRGRVGFISALSDHFCGSCNRLRLTADGALKLCLYSDPVLDLRAPLRRGASDSDLSSMVRSVMRRKPAAHPSPEELRTAGNRAMTEIGG